MLMGASLPFPFFPSNQAQKEELKVAKEQAAEGEEQRLLWEEVEKENSRLKTEIASLPVLQKENDRMKKELESVPALQKELETLRSTVTNLKLSPGTRVRRRKGLVTKNRKGKQSKFILYFTFVADFVLLY